MTRVMCYGLALCCVLGCESGHEPPRGAFLSPKPAVEKAPPREPRRFIDTPDPATIEDVVLDEIEEETATEETKRDLGGELAQAIGTPLSCLGDFEAGTPVNLRIPVSATVRPTGMVIQPLAAAVGLSPEARRCIEQRAAIVKLAPLAEETSQSVSTVIEIDYNPSVIVQADGQTDPVLRNVRAPLDKRAEVAPSGRPIQEPKSRPIAKPTSRDPTGPTGRPIRGPKPRAIDGYEVDENSQRWR